MATKIPPQLLEPYRNAWNRLQDLRRQRGEMEAERSRLMEANSKESWQQSNVTTAALALLDDPEGSFGNSEEFARRRDRITEIDHKLPVVAEAAKLQEKPVAEAANVASKAVCDHLRPAYAAIMTRMARAIRELAAAQADEKDLREAIGEAGLSFTAGLRPIIVRGFEPSSSPMSPNRAEQLLAEIREYYPEVK